MPLSAKNAKIFRSVKPSYKYELEPGANGQGRKQQIECKALLMYTYYASINIDACLPVNMAIN